MNFFNISKLIFIKKKKPLLLAIVVIIILVLKRITESNPHDFIPKQFHRYLRFGTCNSSNKLMILLEKDGLKKLRFQLEKINSYHRPKNRDKFGPVMSPTVYIVIQVNRDIERLQYLVTSLAQVQNIKTTLLIFSHSYYDECMNNLINSITFAKVKQIYFPYSIQQYNNYPGLEPQCKIQNGHSKNCTRDAYAVEHKQHWWWKVRFVFDVLPWSYDHNAFTIFIEEFHFVSPDMLYMLEFVERVLDDYPAVQVVSFGGQKHSHLGANLISINDWRPEYSNGIAFRQSAWKIFKIYADHYCLFEDSRWSYSLWNLFTKLPRSRVLMMTFLAPRVISTLPYKNPIEGAAKIFDLFKKMHLFPRNVKIVNKFSHEGRIDSDLKFPTIGFGGWYDIRDKLLCLSYDVIGKPVNISNKDLDYENISNVIVFPHTEHVHEKMCYR